MGKKSTRSGKKFGGDHTTVVPGAGIIADIALSHRDVTKISVGFITSGLRPTKGVRRIKCMVEPGSLRISVRDGIAHQELRVFARDISQVQKYIIFEAAQCGFQTQV